MNTHELAWAAGFFDGEGHSGNVSSTRRDDGLTTKRFYISVTQIDLAVLERFRVAVDGRSRVYGPYQAKGPRKPYWVFQTSSFQDSQQIIAKLWKWLSPVKRAQAKAAIIEITKYFARPKRKRRPTVSNFRCMQPRRTYA